MPQQKFFWLAVLLLASTAIAAAPTVDFNIVPTSATVFQSVVFDPGITSSSTVSNMRWQFDSDGNANYFSSVASSDYNLIDDFESGSLAAWTVESGTSSTIQSAVVKNGTKALQELANPTSDNIWRRISFISDANYKVFARNNNTATITTYLQLTNNAGDVSAITRINAGAFSCATTAPGTYTNFGGTADTNKWYRLSASYTTATSKANCYVFDENDVLLYSLVGQTPWNAGNPSQIRLASTTGPSYFDDIQTGNGSGTAINTDLNQTHSFTSTGTKNVCLSAGNTDGNTTTCHTISISGNIIFHVFDENTKALIPNPIAVLSGTTFVGTSGTVNVNVPTLPGEQLIEISDANHPARSFVFNLSSSSAINQDIFLIDSNKSRAIDFLIRDENRVKYPEKLLRIMKDGNLVWQTYTDDRAIITQIPLANLVTDYNFFVDTNTDLNVIFSYADDNLTIMVPLNESTREAISPYGYSITHLTSIDENNLSTSKIKKIYPNTLDPYAVAFDANGLGYVPRYYSVRALPKTNVVLQPYLLRITDSALPGTFVISDSITGLRASKIVIEFRGDVGSTANVLLESPISDSAGEFIFTSITGKRYDLTIINQYGDTIKTGLFTSSTQTTYYLDIFTGVIALQQPEYGIIDINVLVPQGTGNFLALNPAGNYGFRFKLFTDSTSAITSITATATQGGSTIGTHTYSPVFPASSLANAEVFDFNISTTNTSDPIEVHLAIVTNAGTISKNWTFTNGSLIDLSGYDDFFQSFQDSFGGVLIWLLVYFCISAVLRFAPLFGLDNSSMTWVLVVWTGIAAYIHIIPYLYGFIGICAGVALWVMGRRPVG